MRNEIGKAASAYGSARATVGHLFLMLVAGVFLLMLLGAIWILASSLWNSRTLRFEGVEAEAQVVVRAGPPIQIRGRLQETQPDFGVSWTDALGRCCRKRLENTSEQ